MTALQIYLGARARGLRFTLVGPGTVRIDGPESVLDEFDAAIDAASDNLVALAGEFEAASPVVLAAQAILRDAGSSSVRGVKAGPLTNR